MTRDLLVLQIPLLEKVLPTVAVYLFLVLALRFGGKRDLAQRNSFDLVVLLLSNTVQNAIIGPTTAAGGLLGAAVLLAAQLHHRAAWVPAPGAGPTLEGTPTTLVQDDRMLDHTSAAT